jgi:ADP-ribose pyrophosphatase YjhB (NUDIX family)
MELKLFVATKALIEHDGKVLVVRESSAYKDGVNAGKCDVVGGRITPGERLEDALRREVKEETGMDIEIGPPFFADESIPRPVVRGEEWQVVKIYFPCKPLGGEVVLSGDHSEFLWIDPKDHKSAGLIENLHPVFEAYLKRPS